MAPDNKKFVEEKEEEEDKEEEEEEEEVEEIEENIVPQIGPNTEESKDLSEEKSIEISDDKLPFPRATITKLVRKNVSKGKQIKGSVKDEMNLWVASMVERIAKKMNSQPYTFVNYEMLKEAVAPYEDIQGINKQREQLVKKINAIKTECDTVINQIDSEIKSKSVSLKLESEEMPFPKATITNKLRKYLGDGKTIKGPVKRGLNVWMGSIVERVSKKMDSYTYPYIDRSMFKEAIEPYEAVGEIELEKERIIQQMESMKTACDLLVMEIERKFKL
ncbi:MAG: hypothetical protein WC462_03915 [archaeon]